MLSALVGPTNLQPSVNHFLCGLTGLGAQELNPRKDADIELGEPRAGEKKKEIKTGLSQPLPSRWFPSTTGLVLLHSATTSQGNVILSFRSRLPYVH